MKTRINRIATALLFVLLLIATTANSQCIVNYTTNSPTSTNNASGPYNYGQSFIAECSGYLEYFEFISTSTGTVTLDNIRVYAGNTVAGAWIYTQLHSDIVVTTIGDPVRFDIAGIVPLVLNDQYTFRFTINIVDIEFETSTAYKNCR